MNNKEQSQPWCWCGHRHIEFPCSLLSTPDTVLSCLLVSLVLATTCLAHKWNLLPPESYMHMHRHKCILESCPDDPLKPLSAHSIEPQVWI